MALSKNKKLSRSFYNRPTLEVLGDIIGKIVVYNSLSEKLSARIVEAEAYIGEEDPACHAAGGITNRNQIMYGNSGHAYIYIIYGMYNCLNFVTEPKSKPAAILLRGAEPVSGIDIMKSNSPNKSSSQLLNGPGKFCRSLGLSREHNGLDLTKNMIYLEDDLYKPKKIIKTERIGISTAKEKKWRYYDAASNCVSRK